MPNIKRKDFFKYIGSRGKPAAPEHDDAPQTPASTVYRSKDEEIEALIRATGDSEVAESGAPTGEEIQEVNPIEAPDAAGEGAEATPQDDGSEEAATKIDIPVNNLPADSPSYKGTVTRALLGIASICLAAKLGYSALFQKPNSEIKEIITQGFERQKSRLQSLDDKVEKNREGLERNVNEVKGEVALLKHKLTYEKEQKDSDCKEDDLQFEIMTEQQVDYLVEHTKDIANLGLLDGLSNDPLLAEDRVARAMKFCRDRKVPVEMLAKHYERGGHKRFADALRNPDALAELYDNGKEGTTAYAAPASKHPKVLADRVSLPEANSGKPGESGKPVREGFLEKALRKLTQKSEWKNPLDAESPDSGFSTFEGYAAELKHLKEQHTRNELSKEEFQARAAKFTLFCYAELNKCKDSLLSRSAKRPDYQEFAGAEESLYAGAIQAFYDHARKELQIDLPVPEVKK